MSGRPKRVRNALKNRYTNQTGLMQAGSAPRIGRQGPILSLLGRRVNSRLQTCGQGYKGLRCRYELNPNTIGEEAIKRYCKRVVNYDPLTVCNNRQPKNRQNAGGVGNIYTSRRDNCNQKCGTITSNQVIKDNFSSGSLENSNLFVPFTNTQNDHHNVEIVKSGTLWPGHNHKSPFYKAISSGWTTGFISDASPLPSPYHVRFGGKGEQDANGNTQGRFLKSKIFDFTNLVSITVSYIAGGINGELLNAQQKTILQNNLSNTAYTNSQAFSDTFNNPIFNSTFDQSILPKIPILQNGGDIPDVGPSGSLSKEPEDLFIQFYNNNNQPIGQEFTLFTPKIRPVIQGKGDLNIYGSSKFSLKTFYITDPQILNQSSYFKIQQRRHTDILDNYGIKFAECKFSGDPSVPFIQPLPDIQQPIFVKKFPN